MVNNTKTRLAKLEKEIPLPEPPKAWKIVISQSATGETVTQHYLNGAPIDEGRYKPGKTDKIKVKLIED